MYADDTLLLADTAEELQYALNRLSLFCEEWKLKINKSKTEVMIFGKTKTCPNRYNFTLNGDKLEQCNKFKYLGVIFNYNGKFIPTSTKSNVCST